MTSNELLSLLWSTGYTLRLGNDQILIKPTPPNDVCDLIREHKPEIMARLRRGAEIAGEFREIVKGIKPTWFTLAGRCAKCGPVWLPDWALPEVTVCPWCFVPRTVTIPRPTDARLTTTPKPPQNIEQKELAA